MVSQKIFDELFQGIFGLADIGILSMFVIGFVLIWLAVKYDYEPVLLLPMGIGCVLANIPGHYAVLDEPGNEGFLNVLYNAGIANELFPVLIFVGIGAMCEFDPLMRKPFVMLFAAAASSVFLPPLFSLPWWVFRSMKRLPSGSSAQPTARPPFSWLPVMPPACSDRCPWQHTAICLWCRSFSRRLLSC